MDLERIDRTDVANVGGKGAQLGELIRIEGIRVPGGFCVTTDAFERAVAGAPSIAARLDRLSRLSPDDREAIRTVSAQIRRAIEGTAIPGDVVAAIGASLRRFGAQAAFAVRSSATAEDLPGASFAGQHDSYLDIVGASAIIDHVRRCWASLFSERAVTYRRRNPTSLTYDRALEEALCYGWIDGQVRGGDECSYRQRFTPRGPRSGWSRRNVAIAERLMTEGRMQATGLAAVERAKADGRWEAAYAGPASIAIPLDLATALDANPAARAMFENLSGHNRYAVLYRIETVKRAETRRRRIEQFISMLERGETIYPQRRQPR